MKKHIILITLLLLLSCKKDENKYAYKLIYDNSFLFKNNDFIKIDEQIFKHSKYLDSLNLYLPAEYIILKKGNREFKEKSNRIFLVMNLANKLVKTNKYKIHNKAQVMVEGILIISNVDSSKIVFEKSKKYPLRIEKINLTK